MLLNRTTLLLCFYLRTIGGALLAASGALLITWLTCAVLATIAFFLTHTKLLLELLITKIVHHPQLCKVLLPLKRDLLWTGGIRRDLVRLKDEGYFAS